MQGPCGRWAGGGFETRVEERSKVPLITSDRWAEVGSHGASEATVGCGVILLRLIGSHRKVLSRGMA